MNLDGLLKSAVFLDRDGTVIEDPGYLRDPEDVRLLPRAAEALRLMSSAGFALVLVSNQAGVARGYLSIEEVEAVQVRLAELLAKEGISLSGAYFCPHHPDFTGPCRCRKPGTAMVERGARELGLDLSSSWVVGDAVSDIEVAARLGLPAVLVMTGRGPASAPLLQSTDRVWIAQDLLNAARQVVSTVPAR